MLRPLLVRALMISVNARVGSFVSVTRRRSARPLTVRTLFLPMYSRARVTRTPLGARKRTVSRRLRTQLFACAAPPLIETNADAEGTYGVAGAARSPRPPPPPRQEPSALVTLKTSLLWVA